MEAKVTMETNCVNNEAIGQPIHANPSFEGESLWLFDDLPQPTGRSGYRRAPASNHQDPIQRAQKLAKKVPYLPRGQGQRQRAGHAICRLLLASLAHSTSAGAESS